MQFIASPYQTRAIEFLCNSGNAALYLDMGLGKSVITATAIQHHRDEGCMDRALIVGPKRVVTSTWPTELAKWNHLHLTHTIIDGSPIRRIQRLGDATDLHLINYEQLPWLCEQFKPQTWPYDLVVFDESSRMKSAQTKRFKAFRKMLGNTSVWLLSGTPAPNGLLDLWAQLFLLDKGERLGKAFTHFRARYFKGDYNGWKWEPYPDTQQLIEQKIADLCLSMSAADYLTLPDRINNVLSVQMPDAAVTSYKALQDEFLVTVMGQDVVAANSAVLTSKLLQAANGHVYDIAGGVAVLHSAKLDALEEVVEEAAGAPVLVVYQFRSDLECIKDRFPSKAMTLDDVTVEDWNSGRVPMLCIHPASAGHGLNLQDGGNIMVWFGLTWNLEHYQQTCARLHRQGQTKPTFVHHIIASNTIDERVLSVLQGKATVQEALMQALKEAA